MQKSNLFRSISDSCGKWRITCSEYSLLRLTQLYQTAGRSRIYREIARQGLLPFPNFFAYTKPFGTPLGPILLMWVLTAIVIVALPSGDVFNFIVDLESYPKLVGRHRR